MLSTWPAFTAAMYVLGSASGWRSQEPLRRMVRAGHLVLAEMTASRVARVPTLMEQYRDLRMDVADASLVALAEEQRLREVFTLDSDFRVYRLPGGHAFNLGALMNAIAVVGIRLERLPRRYLNGRL